MVYDIVEWSKAIANQTFTVDDRDLSLTEPEAIDSTDVDERPTFRSTSEDVTIVDVMRPNVANAYDLGWLHGETLEKFQYPTQWERRYWKDYTQGYTDGMKARVRRGA